MTAQFAIEAGIDAAAMIIRTLVRDPSRAFRSDVLLINPGGGPVTGGAVG